MDYSRSFSVLNAKMKPRLSTSEQIYSSLSRLKTKSYRQTVLPAEPALSVFVKEKLEEPIDEQDSMSDCPEEGTGVDMDSSCTSSDLSVKDEGEEEEEDEAASTAAAAGDEDSSSCKSEEKESAGEPASEATGKAPAGESENTFKRDYDLPDLITCRLSRRRTLGHVSDTLKEVRREVELSRRRSIKLKAQVDKLQEGGVGPGWSRNQERVTEELLSILRLLRPLTEEEAGSSELALRENRLDDTLAQLKNVARKLAINLTQQEVKSGKGSEDGALLQQALRDRDEAIEKKKAMETELLRSKSEMMMLNNQLLEAAQKRLEMSLELEAWKEDMQLMLSQQLQLQQQAEQAQKKPSRMGLLRRNNKAPIQRPVNFPKPQTSPNVTISAGTNHTYIPRAPTSPTASSATAPAGSQFTWMDKLRGKAGRQGSQEGAGQEPRAEWGRDDGFQVVSLD